MLTNHAEHLQTSHLGCLVQYNTAYIYNHAPQIFTLDLRLVWVEESWYAYSGKGIQQCAVHQNGGLSA